MGLVAPSAHVLREMLGTFSEFADVVDFKLNGAKRQHYVFGRQSSRSFISVARVELLNSSTIIYLCIEIRCTHISACGIESKSDVLFSI